jgi:hypothetical protein
MPNGSKVDPKQQKWTSETTQKIVDSWRSLNFDISLLKLKGKWEPNHYAYVQKQRRPVLLMPRLYVYFTKEIAQK